MNLRKHKTTIPEAKRTLCAEKIQMHLPCRALIRHLNRQPDGSNIPRYRVVDQPHNHRYYLFAMTAPRSRAMRPLWPRITPSPAVNASGGGCAANTQQSIPHISIICRDNNKNMSNSLRITIIITSSLCIDCGGHQ